MLSNIGWSGLILILVALLLVFGPSKLPEIGKAFGKSLREFRNATKEMTDGVAQAVRGEDAADGKAAVPVSPSVEPIVLQEKSAAESRPSQG